MFKASQINLQGRDGNPALRHRMKISADPSILRVSPGDPDHSLLFQVVQAPVPDTELGELEQMPVGAALDDDDIDQLRRWIEAGAENN